MKVKCLCTDRDFYKVSVGSGRMYEFVNKECEVTDKEDIEYFSDHNGYEIQEEIKKKKVKGEEDGL